MKTDKRHIIYLDHHGKEEVLCNISNTHITMGIWRIIKLFRDNPSISLEKFSRVNNLCKNCLKTKRFKEYLKVK